MTEILLLTIIITILIGILWRVNRYDVVLGQIQIKFKKDLFRIKLYILTKTLVKEITKLPT